MSIKIAALFFAVCVFALVASPPAFADSPDPGDDESFLQPAEPDFRLINLPTTLRLPLHGGNFDLTHRFNGNLRRGTFRQQASGSVKQAAA